MVLTGDTEALRKAVSGVSALTDSQWQPPRVPQRATMSETHGQWCTVRDMMHQVRAEPPDHRTRSAGLETGEACQSTLHSPRDAKGVGVGHDSGDEIMGRRCDVAANPGLCKMSATIPTVPIGAPMTTQVGSANQVLSGAPRLGAAKAGTASPPTWLQPCLLFTASMAVRSLWPQQERHVGPSRSTHSATGLALIPPPPRPQNADHVPSVLQAKTGTRPLSVGPKTRTVQRSGCTEPPFCHQIP